jgi:hypothetical protein
MPRIDGFTRAREYQTSASGATSPLAATTTLLLRRGWLASASVI